MLHLMIGVHLALYVPLGMLLTLILAKSTLLILLLPLLLVRKLGEDV
jgi:hypothetical protein